MLLNSLRIPDIAQNDATCSASVHVALLRSRKFGIRGILYPSSAIHKSMQDQIGGQ